MNKTIIDLHNDPQKCGKDALTDMFGWFLQVLLACLAFTCLILKRFCEPRYERRPWLIWFYDTSKQGMGALVIHLANIYLASTFQEDPCTWYIINFLLDSSVGLFIIYIGIRLSQYLARVKRWEAINFGKPPSMNAWLAQCCLYVILMVIVKICITLLIQFDFWEAVRHFILSPITNAKVEQAIVMLIIPFFVNALMFWVTDNFLMRHNNRRSHKTDPGLLQRVKVRYRRIKKDKRDDSEADVLLLADEELLGSNENLQQRLPSVTIT
ncbi:store-operated calcium entry regulator STIMATE isoform X2 [Anabrus simplex]|uniref:store-operated calcium entry regulator STIMATE isoform X2 n=1 Tax=Anabrus simplex TaxID=316456 RepID=UPI0034DD24B6